MSAKPVNIYEIFSLSCPSYYTIYSAQTPYFGCSYKFLNFVFYN